MLFSAAGGHESYALLIELATKDRIELITSVYCLEEARRNLAAKRPYQAAAFARLAEHVRLVPDSVGELPWHASREAFRSASGGADREALVAFLKSL